MIQHRRSNSTSPIGILLEGNSLFIVQVGRGLENLLSQVQGPKIGFQRINCRFQSEQKLSNVT